MRIGIQTEIANSSIRLAEYLPASVSFKGRFIRLGPEESVAFVVGKTPILQVRSI